MKKIIYLFPLFAFSQFAFSQMQYVSFRIDSAVKADMQVREIPGMQVAIVKYGLVIKKGHYGYSNLEDRIAVTDSTRFSIASLSKPMICAAILLLMEDGKLNIDDAAGKYLDSLPLKWRDVSVKQLMYQGAGPWDVQGEDDNRGAGPSILAMIIAKVSGQTYANFMQQRIFDKLGMSNSCVNNHDSIIYNRAQGYILKDSNIIHGARTIVASAAVPDPSMLTTVSDMLKWYAALTDTSMLKQSSLDMMFSPGLLNDSSKTSFGLGWFVRPYRDHALISHTGGFKTGFNAAMEMYPEDHVCIIVMGNLFNGGAAMIAKDIIGLFNPDYGRASRMDSVADPDSVQTLLLKSYFTELGLNTDTTRRLAAALHLPYYPVNDADLAPFRNVTEFTFIKAIKPKTPAPDVFGDMVQAIYIYKVKCKDQPERYISFLTDPTGKLVYLDYEE